MNILLNVYCNQPLVICNVRSGSRADDLSVLLLVLPYFDKFSNSCPVLKRVSLLFKAVTSQARNQNGPKIPVDDTANKSAHGYR